MKSDLDSLMQERGFDAIVVLGEVRENPALRYMIGGSRVSDGIVIKKRGETPVLVCNAMERDEADKSGLRVVTTNDFDFYRLIKEAGSLFEGELRMLANVLEHFGVGGKVSFYGREDPGKAYVMLRRLEEMLSAVTVSGEPEATIFDTAFATKDADEIAQIKSVAERTNRVMAKTVDFIRGHIVEQNRLVKANGDPLTVGDVRRFVLERLLDSDLEEAGDTIFAIGRDAGVPHSRGEDGDILELGKSIVFDLYPRGAGGGYYHDMTRTFCLGFAPDEVQRAYDQVMEAFDASVAALEVGEIGKTYQALVCDIFEKYGHPTPRSKPGTEEGYVHSLGHGLGLEVHSEPRLSVVGNDPLQPGHVFTIEPGLYYPKRGFGVRIEDTFYVDKQGDFHSLSTYPKDLVIAFE
ncbi:MAG: aminopeptidase P family protein [Anaerolineae bacterium]|nr:aminopeptidase P family protein [Anaerolineae bacterium]